MFTTAETICLVFWKNMQLFVLLSPGDIQMISEKLSFNQDLNIDEVKGILTRVYKTWYEEELKKAYGSAELLETLSRLHAIEVNKGILKYL